MFNSSYKGRKVLVTGHTGFKGAWLSLWLHDLEARVSGLALPAPTQPSFHELLTDGVFEMEIVCDIRDFQGVRKAVEDVAPEIIFHLAAQPIVRRSYTDPLETFMTNALGAAHLLESVRQIRLSCPVVIVTSDKCYENKEWQYAYRESDPLGGHDVYSMSKAATELVAKSWNQSFFAPDAGLGRVVTARAGNVIGGGDYAVDRIVPDCVRALMAGQPIGVRNPDSVRPWQHVLECLSGYLWLGAQVFDNSDGRLDLSTFNFGPEASARQPVRRLVEEILATWPGSWRNMSDVHAPHEAVLLTLAIEKANAILGWRPVWTFAEAVQKTISWYRERHVNCNQDMMGFSRGQIKAYADEARRQQLLWAK